MLTPLSCPLFLTLAYIAIYDIKSKTIYNGALYILVLILIINYYIYDQPINILSGALVLSVNSSIYIFYRWRLNRECMGTGDIKLATILALFFPAIEVVPVFIFLCGIYGIITFYLITLIKNKYRYKGKDKNKHQAENKKIPFAPAIIFAYLSAYVSHAFNITQYLY